MCIRCVYFELSNVVVFCKCVCILSVCTANGIPRLKDRRVDSWVVIAWAYFCWRDSGGFVFASLSLTFGVVELCGCLNFVGFRDVGRNSCGGILRPRRCVGSLLHGGGDRLLRREPLLRNPAKPRRPASEPRGKPRSGSRAAAPAAALFSGRALYLERGRAGDPELGRGPRCAQRARFILS
ncbi:hypothetical protein NDU88_002701 [Pleurodeles waltl]|uniref:Uncharacterized protein n=1 Tax=Pleurodeles waltl TaxID=8319 RepID=A0AAV7LD79_PLEWA|nr:hypothetical protein NDU88_002701 [Pleurodeles waltl]